MTALALSSKGAVPLWHEIVGARAVLFWLMLGGFVWVIGDLFQQYAAKYVGISRGVPLSNTNQLWGLVWGILVFHELPGGRQRVYTQVIGGSILMALGAVAIALSSASGLEHSRWRAAAEGVGDDYVRAGIEGRETGRRGGAQDVHRLAARCECHCHLWGSSDYGANSKYGHQSPVGSFGFGSHAATSGGLLARPLAHHSVQLDSTTRVAVPRSDPSVRRGRQEPCR